MNRGCFCTCTYWIADPFHVFECPTRCLHCELNSPRTHLPTGHGFEQQAPSRRRKHVKRLCHGVCLALGLGRGSTQRQHGATTAVRTGETVDANLKNSAEALCFRIEDSGVQYLCSSNGAVDDLTSVPPFPPTKPQTRSARRPAPSGESDPCRHRE